jgi:hypothetical protein
MPSQEPASFYAAIADWSAAMFEPHIVAEVVALLGELTPEQGARLTQLVDAVDAAASRRMFDASEQTWAGVIAHFPGLAPALDFVRYHVEERSGLCPLCGGWQEYGAA